MPNIERIEGYADELTAIRRDLHAHPEIGFEEVRTSGIVADKMKQWGIDVHRGIGGTMRPTGTMARSRFSQAQRWREPIASISPSMAMARMARCRSAQRTRSSSR